MSKLKIIVLAAFCLLAVILWADIALPSQSAQFGSPYIVNQHINGFQDFPGVDFYKVRLWGIVTDANDDLLVDEGTSLSCQKITSNNLIIDGSIGIDLISWDKQLRTLEENKKYNLSASGLGEPFTSKDPSVDKTLDWQEFDDFSIRGFHQIDSYYQVIKLASEASDADPRFRLSLIRRVYRIDKVAVIAMGDFDNLRKFMATLNLGTQRRSFSEIVAHPIKRFVPLSDTLVAYAKTLRDHHVVLLGEEQGSADKFYATLDPSIKITFDIPKPRFIVKMMESLKPDVDSNLFIVALMFSIVIEFLVLLLLFKPLTMLPASGLKQILCIFLTCGLATGFTITINWWVFPLFIRIYLINLLVTELFAIGVEAFVYGKVFRIPFKTALFLSLACNLCSYGGGVLLFSGIV
ncbi:MAG: hypothetical protein RBS43_04260 [Candidatus Cloacimonas sp.]|nr:hypothetical protein [Candidatus Cloacimonas sp.]